MERQKPNRKHPRLKNYDYSAPGAYSITICTEKRRCILSQIMPDPAVGRGFTPAVCLTEYGKIVEKHLLLLEERYPSVHVDHYVIMPNHIHVILRLEEAAGPRPRPTVMDVVGAFKSLATRECKAFRPIPRLFQTSFFEHAIRNTIDYEEAVTYIRSNPHRWMEDELYIAE